MKDWLKNNKRVTNILLIILILIALSLTLVLVKQRQNQQSSAAATDKLETEGGTLSSTGVSRQSDNTASGGQFVLFQAQTNTPTNSPSSPAPTSPPSQGGGTARATAYMEQGRAVIFQRFPQAVTWSSCLPLCGQPAMWPRLWPTL